MICPVCNKSMLILEYRDIETDHCASCRGVWLDADELELIAGAGPGAAAAAITGRKSGRRCPRCGAKMRAGPLPGTAIELDACPRGHGYWFDRGELEAVLKATGAEGAAAQVAEYLADMFGMKK